MTAITLKKAQEDLPLLVERALAGEEIVIEAEGTAAVKLAPVAPAAEHPLLPGRKLSRARRAQRTAGGRARALRAGAGERLDRS
jgi:antitoxin (DNA-binding transcriptional repressor) of toxin-antitoxin stability system